MNIQDALKETGKARNVIWTKNAFIEIIDCEFINHQGEPYFAVNLLTDSWQPYHPKEEIRPKKIGELWKHKETNDYFHVDMGTSGSMLCLVGYNGRQSVDDSIIHGEYWKRISPEVKGE